MKDFILRMLFTIIVAVAIVSFIMYTRELLGVVLVGIGIVLLVLIVNSFFGKK